MQMMVSWKLVKELLKRFRKFQVGTLKIFSVLLSPVAKQPSFTSSIYGFTERAIPSFISVKPALRGGSNITSGFKNNISYRRGYEFSNSSRFTRMHCIYPERTAPLFTRVHCATNNTRMSHSRVVVLFSRGFQWAKEANLVLGQNILSGG